MLEKLFSSRVRTKLLTKFLLSPGIGFNAWELAQSLDENYSAVWRELGNLERLGILQNAEAGNARVYNVNPHCSIIPELRSIFIKTEGVGEALRSQLTQNPEIKAAFIFGSYASGDADMNSDLDLMIIGNIELNQFALVIASLERDLQRPINYLIYSIEEWDNKLANGDAFALNVKNSPKIMLIGGEDGL